MEFGIEIHNKMDFFGIFFFLYLFIGSGCKIILACNK